MGGINRALALPTVETFRNKIYHGESLTLARSLPDNSVNCIVTSPPYYGLRSYLPDDHPDKKSELGLEDTPQAYIGRMVELFRELRRVLRPDGTAWLNLGDSYNGSGKGWQTENNNGIGGQQKRRGFRSNPTNIDGLAPKNLLMIPHRVAIALQDDGWIIRSDIIWHKPNPMPESVKDRPTKAHEYIFLMTKSPRYAYDADAIREPYPQSSIDRYQYPVSDAKDASKNGWVTTKDRASRKMVELNPLGRNKRSVWTMATRPFPDAHFAVFPPELPELCIRAGCPVGGIVYDPFMGSGTTALVAARLQRDFIGSELNAEYVEMARKRLADGVQLEMFAA